LHLCPQTASISLNELTRTCDRLGGWLELTDDALADSSCQNVLESGTMKVMFYILFFEVLAELT
jgi:hypothetical protein